MTITTESDGGLYFRSSMTSELLTSPRGKSPAQKLEDISGKLVAAEKDYALTANKLTKTAIKLSERIEKMTAEVAALELIKDQPHFSETALKSARKQWIVWKYNRFRSIDNKFTTKGKLNEELGITMVSLVKDRVFKKNDVRLFDHENRISGEPDLYEGASILDADETLDIKCSWDIQTFYDSISSKLKPVYDGQGQSYMHLTGAKRHRVCFCLIDTPYMQVLDEIKKETFGNWNGDMPKWAQVQTLMNHVYTEKAFDACLAGLDIDPKSSGMEARAVYESFVPVPMDKRYYEFVVERDQEKIEKIKTTSRYFHKYAQEQLDTYKFINQLSNINSEEENE
jgi:hypothetical protein